MSEITKCPNCGSTNLEWYKGMMFTLFTELQYGTSQWNISHAKRCKECNAMLVLA